MNSNIHQLIERYVYGAMSRAESQEFEKLLASDETLRDLVAAERYISDALNSDKNAELSISLEPSAQLLSVLQSTPVQTVGSLRSGMSMWSLQWWAASLVSVGITGVVIGVLISSWLKPTAERAVPVIQHDTIYAPAGAVPTQAFEHQRDIQNRQDAPLPASAEGTRRGKQSNRPAASAVDERIIERNMETPTADEYSKAMYSNTVVGNQTVYKLNALSEADSSAIRQSEQQAREANRSALRNFLRQSELAPVNVQRRDSVEIRLNVEKHNRP